MATIPLSRAGAIALLVATSGRAQRIVLFGGKSRDGSQGDTWEYDGQRWTRLDVTGPTPRNAHAMVFDPRTKAVLLYGGRKEPATFDDLWSFDGHWTRIGGSQPERER